MSLDHLPGRSDPETRLRAWLDEQAPTSLPAGLAERVRAIPAVTPMPSRRTRVGRAGRATWSGARLLAAAAIVAVGVGALVVAGDQLRSAPAPTLASDASPLPAPAAVSVRPVLPVPLPSGIEGGTIDTPIGPARWVHLTGPGTPPADSRVPVAWFGDGLLYVSYGTCADEGELPPCTHPGSPPAIQTAPDALAPLTAHPLPVAAQGIVPMLDGDTLWLSTITPDGLWRTTDLEHWEPIDLSAVAPEPVDGVGWRSNGVGAITGPGGETMLSVGWGLADPGRLVGLDGVEDIFPIALQDGVYLIRQLGPARDAEPRDLARVRLEVSPEGLRFRTLEGELLSELPGLDQRFVDDWATFRTIHRQTLVRLGPDGLSTVQLPGRDPATRAAVLPVAGGWLAVAIDTEDGPVLTWRSSDGRTWVQDAPLGDTDGPFSVQSIHADTWHRPARLIAVLDESHTLTSTDGITWAALGPLSDRGAQLASGSWVRWDDMEGGGIEVSTDGISWQPTDPVTATWGPDTMGEVAATYSGTENTVGAALFRLWDRDPAPGIRDLWIVDFAPVTP
ncbi:MAG: hypothetical protein U0869_18800 [Chloroflexota bacterium]